MKLWSLLLLPVFALSAQAVVLSPVGSPTAAPLPIDVNAPNIPCDQIVTALQNFNSMYSQNNNAIGQFLDQLTGKLSEWHGQLVPLENSTQNLPAGTFSVLLDGADKVGQLKLIADDNVTLLSTELARIQDSLGACLITSKSTNK